MSDTFHGAADDQAFRHELEAALRDGEPDTALARVRGALATLAQGGSTLAERCLAIGPEDITVAGWAALAGRVRALDRPGKPITAIGIDLSDPGAHSDRRPDATGRLDPHIETNYFSDDAFSFSGSDRKALLAGYLGSGSKWQGCFVDIDNTISIEGLADLYGPIYALERMHARGRNGGPDFEMAVVGSSYVAVLVHVAVLDAVRRQGLPRPMAVLVGSNESYPYFDAPAIAPDEHGGAATPVSPDALDTMIADVAPSAEGQSGTSLRRQIAARGDAESALSDAPPRRAGLFARLLGKG